MGRISHGWSRIAAAVFVVMAIVGVGAMAPVADAAPTVGLEGVPRFDHIVVLTLENENASTSFGAASPAHYLNGLLSQGVFVPGYYGTSHVSLPNYIAMVSGQLPNGLTNTDCAVVSLYVCAQPQTLFANGRHLGDQLDASGKSWKVYQDGASAPCFHGAYSTDLTALLTPDPFQGDSQAPPGKDVADRHNPFLYFPNLVGNGGRCALRERPFGELAGDVTNNTLPAFSFVVADTCHDGHDNPCSNGTPGGLVSADQFLSTHVPALLTYLQSHNGLLIINFDEDGIVPTGVPNLNDLVCLTCASLGLGGRTGAVLLGAGLTPGKVVSAAADHYSLLRTIEDSFGIGEHLNMAALAKPMVEALTP